ncbi:bromodomain-containing protein 8-like [Athene cunicularia]|uniref:bromodomain-containing protein 8-like n=1 Tax=Athene cunicularia TaxID=194338 RepID=UPI000EF69DC3|nr:bromodomain-containing protein 8-like [Athene cunicularia]
MTWFELAAGCLQHLIDLASNKAACSKAAQHPLRTVGHAWVWWESETESPSESEKNSDFQSLHSWDSVLDLDVRSWRNTEEVAMGKLDKSSPEAGHELELSERLWEDDSEDYQKAERPCEDDSILQLFSEVTQMMEPLRISSTESSQTQGDYCGSGKQGDGEDVRCQEKTTRTAVSGTEESQQHILAEDEKEHFPGREDKTQETPGEQALSELHPQEMSNQAQDQDDSDSTSAAPVLNPTSPANTQLVQLNWDNPLQHFLFKRTLLSIWKMVVSHRYSGPFLKAVSEKQAPGYRDVVKRPMDLTSIKRRLSKGHIQSMAQFQRDLMLMFQNAVMYNSFNHHVHHMAMEMQREVLEQLQMLGEALLCSRDRLEWGRR